MADKQSLIVVVGGSDTGHAPMLAALLQHALPGSIVRSAGVLSHEGEPVAPEVRMALEQLGVGMDEHAARSLDPDEVTMAALLLAVDRGTGRVLQSLHPDAPIAVISDLADAPDVIDPHRMPLGIWLKAAHAYQAQVATALPGIKTKIQTDKAAPVAVPQVDRAGGRSGEVGDSVGMIERLLSTALVMPEIVDWPKLRRAAGEHLDSLIRHESARQPLVAGAAMMLAGVLAREDAIPDPEQITRLLQYTARLNHVVEQDELVELAQMIAAYLAVSARSE
ncbi:MAG: hypothetical protein NVS4B8_09670 [Herpetosiphon sp.]